MKETEEKIRKVLTEGSNVVPLINTEPSLLVNSLHQVYVTEEVGDAISLVNILNLITEQIYLYTICSRGRMSEEQVENMFEKIGEIMSLADSKNPIFLSEFFPHLKYLEELSTHE